MPAADKVADFHLHQVAAPEFAVDRQVEQGPILQAAAQYLRQKLIVGAMAVVLYAERNGAKRPSLAQLLAGRKAKVAAVALANGNARMIWSLMTSGERYRELQPA